MSEAIVPESEQQQQQPKRHMLASGKDFQFGKDRPSSRTSNKSDKAGGVLRKPKADYGQIKSE